MKFLVGVLHSGENEFTQCIRAIESQIEIDSEWFVIQDKPAKLAHQLLYKRFMVSERDFDYFVKIDADMVLCDNNIFAEISACFQNNRDILRLTMPVLDYFTNRLIIGMHAWRSSVRWPTIEDDIFVDMDPVPTEQALVSWDFLAPAAWHCPDPSPFQAFHFGVHKGVKVTSARRKKLHIIEAGHWRYLEDTWRHYKKNPDHRLLLACLGGELAIKESWSPFVVDYTNPFLKYELRNWEAKTDFEVRDVVQTLRRKNRHYIPQYWRIRFNVRRLLTHPLGTMRYLLTSRSKNKLKGITSSIPSSTNR